MARGCLIVAAIVFALAVGVGVLVGPTLYREGRAFVEPVVEMAKSEDAFEALDEEFSFTPVDGDAVVGEERLLEFLAIRRELEPLYTSWRDAVERIEEELGESWMGAKEAVTSTRDVISGQISVLRTNRMSPVEFRWLERIIYRRWLPAVGEQGLPIGTDEVRALAVADIDFVVELERRYGESPALDAVKERLEERLTATGGSGGPAVSGIAPATLALLWQHRDEIARLDLERYELHQVLGRGMSSGIQINGGRVRVD